MIWYVLISIFIVMKNKSSHTVISTAVLVLCSGTLEKQFHTWITSCSHLPHTWSIKTIWPFEKDQACSKCPAGFTDDCEHRPLGCEASFHLTHLGSWAGRRMPHRFFIYREFNPHSLEAALHASPLQRSGNPNLKWLSQVPKMRLSRALNGYWASQEEILLPFAAAASNNDEVVALGAWHIQAPSKTHKHTLVWQEGPTMLVVKRHIIIEVYRAPWHGEPDLSFTVNLMGQKFTPRYR